MILGRQSMIVGPLARRYRPLSTLHFAIAVLAHSSIVAAFSNPDESQLLSKASHDFVADAMISCHSQKRSLRVVEPEDDNLTAADEERTKWAFLDDVTERAIAAETLKGFTREKASKVVQAAKKGDDLTEKEKEVLAILKAMADKN
ncbi:hypothetical protein F441_16460 [Phytophthora nicotianae CJ01A1]|uniref:RxLR effector protein n=1 Tax=Phytophthora nicotianae CJ01A1 TaxID=1317063 RepID=W2W9U6_PHYNI|nr:hypothetical protein F441_16460 [Phytophthora nicotianae CJ01A1]